MHAPPAFVPFFAGARCADYSRSQPLALLHSAKLLRHGTPTSVSPVQPRTSRQLARVCMTSGTKKVQEYTGYVSIDFSDLEGFTPDPPKPSLCEDPLVHLPRPLGLDIDETRDGIVFVAGVREGGNADLHSDIEEGDILTAASLPYGDATTDIKNLEHLLNLISARGEDEPDFILGVRKGDPDILVRNDDGTIGSSPGYSEEEISRMLVEVHSKEYPIIEELDEPNPEEEKALNDILLDNGKEPTKDKIFNVSPELEAALARRSEELMRKMEEL